MIIYLTRHPQTEFNLNKIIQGHSDSPLTEYGREVSDNLRKILENKNIEKIYSSDLGRCRETSIIINQNLNLEIIYSKELRERDFGEYNGQSKELIKNNFDLNNFDIIAPNGESNKQLKDRVNSYFSFLIQNCKEKTILIVTHDGGVKSILSEVLDLGFDDEKCSIKQGEIVKLVLNDKNEKFVIELIK